MDEEPIVDIAKTCRLCLMTDNEADLLEVNEEISNTIEICCIKIFYNGNCSARICANCHSILQFILKFHQMCENSLTYLRETFMQDENFEIITKRDPDINTDDTQSNLDDGEIIINDEINEEILSEMVERDTPETHDQEQFYIDGDNVNEEYVFDEHDIHDEDEQQEEKVRIDQIEYDGRLEHFQNKDEQSSESLLPEEERKGDIDVDDETTVYILDDDNQDQTMFRPIKHNVILKSQMGNTINKVYECEICGNNYRKMGALESHRRRHKNAKPYECEICSESFDYNFKLERHMRKHTGVKPFTCEYCDRKFVDRSTMSRHQKIHRNERAYSCTICSKSFTYYSVLKTHIMSHTGEKPYTCGICDKGFHRASDLKNHLETLQHRKDPRVAELLQNIKRKDEVTLHGFT